MLTFQEFLNEGKKIKVTLNCEVIASLWSTLDDNAYTADEVKGGAKLKKVNFFWDADYALFFIQNTLGELGELVDAGDISVGGSTVTIKNINPDNMDTTALKTLLDKLVEKYNTAKKGNIQGEDNYVDLGGSHDFYPVKGQSDNAAELDGGLILIKSYTIS